MRLSFSRRSCYTGVMHDGSENGLPLLKRPGSDNWYYPPHDPCGRKAILAKVPKDQRPRSWYQSTSDLSQVPPIARRPKRSGPEIAADVERQLKALRDGPKALTAKQVSALVRHRLPRFC